MHGNTEEQGDGSGGHRPVENKFAVLIVSTKPWLQLWMTMTCVSSGSFLINIRPINTVIWGNAKTFTTLLQRFALKIIFSIVFTVKRSPSIFTLWKSWYFVEVLIVFIVPCAPSESDHWPHCKQLFGNNEFFTQMTSQMIAWSGKKSSCYTVSHSMSSWPNLEQWRQLAPLQNVNLKHWRSQITPSRC